MATNFVQDGRMLNYTNSTSAVITSGQVLAVGAVLGVAMDDIAVGASGVIAIEGVFTVPKVSGAEISQGETLTWDISAVAFDDSAATAATGDITGPAAFAAEAAGDGVTSLAVKFTGVPGTVKA
ncbi:capsid cement protein [Microbulbifer sp. DLAB2-AF]|uniref:capsid cement protein n=1 Tax=Microbulbifer sp. DLAB2-AF TaxID=3243395 RepID=UPI00403928FB